MPPPRQDSRRCIAIKGELGSLLKAQTTHQTLSVQEGRSQVPAAVRTGKQVSHRESVSAVREQL